MKAWIENGRVRDVAADDALATFVPEVQALFSTDVPDGTVQGATQVAGAWVNPPPAPAPGPVAPPPAQDIKVGPVEFKLMFTAQERVVIKSLRDTDAMVKDFFELIEDPRLSEVNLSLPSTAAAIGYLSHLGAISPSRVPEILSGKFQ